MVCYYVLCTTIRLRSPESTPAPAPVFYTKALNILVSRAFTGSQMKEQAKSGSVFAEEFIESYSAEAAETSAAQDRLGHQKVKQ